MNRCVAAGVAACIAVACSGPHPTRHAGAADPPLAEAILARRCADCHEAPPGGRVAFSTIATMSPATAAHGAYRIGDGSMPPGQPLDSSERSILVLAMCERASISPRACRQRYLEEGTLVRTVSEVLRTVDRIAPVPPDAPPERKAASETLENQLREHNGRHRSIARLDPTLVLLYTMLARERCASREPAAARSSCEGAILSLALAPLPPPAEVD